MAYTAIVVIWNQQLTPYQHYWRLRGHKNDWDYFASEAGDPAWNYDSVLSLYKRIEVRATMTWKATRRLQYRICRYALAHGGHAAQPVSLSFQRLVLNHGDSAPKGIRNSARTLLDDVRQFVAK